ncbi:hypothetical protein PG990_010176 [Apiospora arundinis]
MHFNALSSIAIMAVAGHAIAEPVPQPRQMNLAKMSVRDIFGLQRRDDGEYQPSETLCGSGSTCAEACGKGFEQCGSKDDQVHCFNPAVGQKCCSGASNGNACDAGFYCAADGKGATWCCKDGDEACGGKIPASLTSSTSVAAATSTNYPTVALPTTSPKAQAPTTSPIATPSSSPSSSPSSVASPVASSSPSSAVIPTTSKSSAVVPATTSSIVAAVSSHSAAANCTTYTTEVVVPISAGGSSTQLITSASKTFVSQTASASATATFPVTASSNNQRPVVAFVLGAAALAAFAL